MNWITNFVRPRIKSLMGGKDGGGGDTPENLWKKCPSCGEMIFHRDLVANLQCLPQLRPSHAHRPGRALRLYLRSGQLHRIAAAAGVPADPLHFRGEKKYADEIKAARSQDRPARSLYRRARHASTACR